MSFQYELCDCVPHLEEVGQDLLGDPLLQDGGQDGPALAGEDVLTCARLPPGGGARAAPPPDARPPPRQARARRLVPQQRGQGLDVGAQGAARADIKLHRARAAVGSEAWTIVVVVKAEPIP